VLIIASSHHGRDSDEALCEIAKDDREMADWSDVCLKSSRLGLQPPHSSRLTRFARAPSQKLAVHKDWYTFPRLHAAANG